MFTASAPTSSTSAWISPKGEFYSLDCGSHNAFATEMLDGMGITNRGEPVTYLECLGWIHVSAGYFYVHSYFKITVPQTDTLFDWLGVMQESHRIWAVENIQAFIEGNE